MQVATLKLELEVCLTLIDGSEVCGSDFDQKAKVQLISLDIQMPKGTCMETNRTTVYIDACSEKKVSEEGCFSAEVTVELETGSLKRLADVTVGDRMYSHGFYEVIHHVTLE